MIKLIVGLGNTGAEYARTRHNIGFWVINAIVREAGAALCAETRFHGCIAHARFRGLNLQLLQPQTFMNRSGQSVHAVAHFYRILPHEILVVHDDLELSPGIAKLKQGGGSGGHNGLKDITSRLSSPEYWRLRIGIGHPRSSAFGKIRIEVAQFVLTPPHPEEQKQIDDAICRALFILPDIVSGNAARAMNKLHCAAP